MSKFSQMKKLLANYFWPFFKDFIWPIIKDEVIEIVKISFENLRKRYEEILNERSNKKEEEARNKAQRAEEKAANAVNEAEAEKYKAVAAVWREVAEDFRLENELLKKELFLVSHKASQDAEYDIKKMQITAEKNKIHLTSGKKIIALPAPSDELKHHDKDSREN